MDRSPINLHTIIETVGVNILCFITPKQLFLLSTVNHHYQKSLHQYIFTTCHQQLHPAVKLGVGTNYLVEFQRGRSFEHKTELWDCMFARLNLTEGMLDAVRRKCGRTDLNMKEALHLLRKLAEEQSTVKVEGARGNTLVNASCNMRVMNEDLSLGLARYILDRDACRKGKGKENYSFVEDWLNFLLRLRSVSVKYWEWDMFHNHKREFGKGLVLMMEGVDEIEIRLTRHY
ncbi:hypothetical protein ACHAW6_005286 [Cyclotella cf. meneghiniana]